MLALLPATADRRKTKLRTWQQHPPLARHRSLGKRSRPRILGRVPAPGGCLVWRLAAAVSRSRDVGSARSTGLGSALSAASPRVAGRKLERSGRTRHGLCRHPCGRPGLAVLDAGQAGIALGLGHWRGAGLEPQRMGNCPRLAGAGPAQPPGLALWPQPAAGACSRYGAKNSDGGYPCGVVHPHAGWRVFLRNWARSPVMSPPSGPV